MLQNNNNEECRQIVWNLVECFDGGVKELSKIPGPTLVRAIMDTEICNQASDMDARAKYSLARMRTTYTDILNHNYDCAMDKIKNYQEDTRLTMITNQVVLRLRPRTSTWLVGALDFRQSFRYFTLFKFERTLYKIGIPGTVFSQRNKLAKVIFRDT